MTASCSGMASIRGVTDSFEMIESFSPGATSDQRSSGFEILIGVINESSGKKPACGDVAIQLAEIVSFDD